MAIQVYDVAAYNRYNAEVKVLGAATGELFVTLAEGQYDPRSVATCGACGRSWDDSIVTDTTPAPSARCPFEYEHREARQYEGFVRYTDGTIVCVQCSEGRHSECADDTGDDATHGPLEGYFCECGCDRETDDDGLREGRALDAIAEMLRDPEWGVGMLEDIAEIVNGTGRSTDNYPDDRSTWARH